MKAFVAVLVFFGLQAALAQVDCSLLTEAVEAAFEKAEAVTMTTQIMQGESEFAYSRVQLSKGAAGDWQRELLERRGAGRPENTRGREEAGEAPGFDFSCEGHVLEATSRGWRLELKETTEDVPVESWTLDMTLIQGTIVPERISGAFEARILLIPFRGSFLTSFDDWQFPE